MSASPADSPQALRIRRRAELQNLELFVWLRWTAIAGQTASVLFVNFGLKIALPLWHIMALLLFLAAANLLAAWRLRQPQGVAARAVLADLLVDVAALTLMLYLTGGATNPFTGLFILQSVVAAFLLAPIEAGVVFVATVAAQFWLLNHGLPLDMPMRHDSGPNQFDLHLQGMFLSFFFSSALAVLFILGIRDNLRQRDARLERQAIQMEEEKVVLRLGLLAGTAAHDLGTPLTSIAVILDDWADLGLPPPEGQRAQIALMQEAVASCRERISHMLRAAGQTRLEEAQAIDLGQLLARIVEGWGRRNPGLTVATHDLRAAGGQVLSDILLERAVENLLDNAREAGARAVTIRISDTGGGFDIEVDDDGPGFPEPVLRGERAEATADDLASHGLGLFLVRSVLRRMGGALALENRAEGGARAVIRLPGIARDD